MYAYAHVIANARAAHGPIGSALAEPHVQWYRPAMRRFTFWLPIVIALLLAACGNDSSRSAPPEEGAAPEAVERTSDASVAAADGGESEEAPQPAGEASGSVTDVPFSAVEEIGMRFAWRVVDGALDVELTGPTTGWIAVGFKPTRAMRDANILIGYVDGSETVMTDQFGVSMTGHRLDSELGGSDDVEAVAGREQDGATTIAFRIPLDSGDEYDQPLVAGESLRVILAHGSDGRDDLTSIHRARGGVDITL